MEALRHYVVALTLIYLDEHKFFCDPEAVQVQKQPSSHSTECVSKKHIFQMLHHGMHF